MKVLKTPIARERVHSAATIAGIAFANAFLGVCHSMAHKLGSQFHIPHGLANALLISNVIRYNANDNPTKQLHSASTTVRRLVVVTQKSLTIWV